jgi:hypothetical protein
MKHGVIILTLIALLYMNGAAYAYAQDKTAQVKAVFLFKFSDYVTWPEAIRPPDGGTFSLCIWGDNPFGSLLEQIAQKQSAYKYKVTYYPLSETPQNCHLVFSGAEASQILRLQGPFLIGDHANFAQQGGMVEMTEEDGKIKLKANLGAAEKAGYKMSSRLLNIMDVIR